VPWTSGATWYPGLDYGRAIPMISHYEPGDIALTNDPYSAISPRIRRISCCGSQSSMTVSCCASRPATSTTPTWAAAVPASLSARPDGDPPGRDPLQSHKLYRAGVLNQELLDVMMTNVRKPDLNVGDLKASSAP